MDTTEAGFCIYAVIVTFDPNIKTLTKCLAKLEPQVRKVLIVDNCSRNLEQIHTAAAGRRHIEIISLQRNAGLGRAHNVGITHAQEGGATHVLLMDHDSIPNERMVSELTAVLEELSADNKPVAAVGARYLGAYAGNESFFVQFGWLKFRRVFCSGQEKRYVRADFLISSGTLIPLAVIQQIGAMDEQLFIDHIDTDWFLRANREGFPSYGACDAFMEHGLGDQTYRVWLGRWHYLPKHKPFRYYYIFRNSILLYKKPYAPAKWMINDIVRLLFILVFYSVVSESRWELMRNVVRGVRDGIRGVTGGKVTPVRTSC